MSDFELGKIKWYNMIKVYKKSFFRDMDLSLEILIKLIYFFIVVQLYYQIQ